MNFKKLLENFHEFIKNKDKIFCSSLAIVFACLSALNLSVCKKTVVINDGETKRSIVTFNTDTDGILKEAGISYSSDDIVKKNLESGELINIEITRTNSVNIVDGTKEFKVLTSEKKVKDVLKENNVSIGDDVCVYPGLDSEVYDDMTVKVSPRVNVNIKENGKITKKYVPAITVKDALINSAVILNENDYSEPAFDEAVADGMTIELHRVTYKDIKTSEKISYDTIKKYSDEIEKGVTVTVKKGKAGEKTIYSKAKYIDGEYVSSELIKSEVTKEPVDEVLKIGTKEQAGSLIDQNGNLVDENGNIINYKQLLTGTCTAYSYSTGSITATGEFAERGKVAVNPNVIPYGTKLYIASPDGEVVYGYCTASDTGGALMNGTVLVDLFYNTDEECFQFGRRTMNVYVLG